MTTRASARQVSAGISRSSAGFLRPIRNEDEHRRAVAVVNGLLDRPALNRDEEDYLDVLGLLIADYEDSIYEHPDFNPIERLRHLMDEHALTQAALARRAGVAVTSLSDILNGKRGSARASGRSLLSALVYQARSLREVHSTLSHSLATNRASGPIAHRPGSPLTSRETVVSVPLHMAISPSNASPTFTSPLPQ